MAKFGVEFVPQEAYWKTTYYAIFAEKKGFDHVWVTDHYNNRNVYSILTTIANYTERIKFGPGVTNPYLTHPVVTAQAMATLSEIAPGRVICGLGPGDLTTLDMVTSNHPKPMTAVSEAVEIIRSLTVHGKAQLEGEVFRVPLAQFNFKPPGAIPIYVGAQGPKMLKLAAKIADGVLINASHPGDFERALEHVRNGVTESGRKLEDLEIIAATSVSVSEDEEKARKAARPVIAFIVAGASERLLEAHGVSSELASSIREDITKARWKDAFSKITNEMYETFTICGKPQDCAEKIAVLIKQGVTMVVAGSPLGPNVRRAIELLSENAVSNMK